MEAWETSMTAKSRKGSHLCQSTLSHELADHPFDHPIKPFHQPVGLGLINQTLTTVSHHMAFNVLLTKAISWSHDLLGEAHACEERGQFTSYHFSLPIPHGDSLRVPGGVIDYHKAILVSARGGGQRPHYVYPYPFERDCHNRHGAEVTPLGTFELGQLAFGA